MNQYFQKLSSYLIGDHNVVLVFSIYAGIALSLFAAEYYYRDRLIEFPTAMDRYLDAGGNYAFVQVLTGILVLILYRNLNVERKKSDDLLQNILPSEVADELKRENTVKAKRFDQVSILFTDMVGFTKLAQSMSPEELVYDLWGDTINTGSRLESSGIPGEINISGDVYKQVKEVFLCEHRGKIAAKGKGELDMFLVSGFQPRFQKNGDPETPNEFYFRYLESLNQKREL
jgi:hypothetical protein